MSSFVDHLQEVFAGLGRVEARRMFGGHGIFHEGRMFALVAHETLYLKADDETAPFFEALGLPAFTYQRQGKTAQLRYRQAPEAVFEDPAAAMLWGRRAFEAALRAKRPPARKPRAGATPAKKSVKSVAKQKTA
jgi:DNA transformation protein